MTPHLPAYPTDDAWADDREPNTYIWHVGGRIGNVSLWARYDDLEYPIYGNTRGREIWNSASVGLTNQDVTEPTDAFYQAVLDLHNPGIIQIDVEDCTWYERECIQSLATMLENNDTIPEMHQLLRFAEAAIDISEDDT